MLVVPSSSDANCSRYWVSLLLSFFVFAVLLS
jgi:hypothetical protein